MPEGLGDKQGGIEFRPCRASFFFGPVSPDLIQCLRSLPRWAGPPIGAKRTAEQTIKSALRGMEPPFVHSQQHPTRKARGPEPQMDQECGSPARHLGATWTTIESESGGRVLPFV